MSPIDYYRGGSSLKPRPIDVRIDPATGLLRPGRGVSVFSRPDGLDRFGGAHRVTQVPPELAIVQVGRNPTHFEIVPVRPMNLDEYEQALGKIVLVPI
jgi:hypothetical protein